MKKLLHDNQAAVEHGARAVRDAKLLPLTLLRRYTELDLNERDLIRLLRLVAHCYNSGSMSLNQVMEEFSVGREDAQVLLRPFLERRLLEYDPHAELYGCDGLRRELYLLWATEARATVEEPTNDISQFVDGPQLEDEQGVRALAHLYRRFEQELGRPLKYSESDRLRSWVDDEAIAPELVEEALKRASLRDRCTLAYIGSILKSWQKKHLTSLQLVLERDEKTGPESVQPTKPAKADKGGDKYAKVNIN